MNELLIVKYGELMLKGNNRPFFIDTLIRNIRAIMSDVGKFRVQKGQSLLYLIFDDMDALEEASARLKRVFGVIVYHRAVEVEKDMEQIKKMSVEYFGKELNTSRSFKIESRRADKQFPVRSMEINNVLGQYIADSFPHLKVDVHHPEVTICVNIRSEGAFLYSSREQGPGGLPVGTGGKALVLVSGGIDSPLAAWLIARRGVMPEILHFYSYPYTSERSKNKVIELARQLSRYTGKLKLHIIPFTEIQENIMENCPVDQVIIIMRRMMMRCAEKLAEREGSQALVTGESIGQVASQTIESLIVINAAVQIPVFRPLIGMDKEEIVDMTREIGTYHISIQPYADCCTMFVPGHPQTKPKLESILRSESKVGFDSLIGKSLEKTELIILEPEHLREKQRLNQ